MAFLDLSTRFVDYVLDGKSSNEKCFDICYPLSLFLELHGFPNLIIRGMFIPKNMTHYWLKVRNDGGNIIDPTRKQFYPNDIESVYHGYKPDEYEVYNKGITNEHERWVEKYQILHYLKENEVVDYNTFVPVTLRAAIFISDNLHDRNKFHESSKFVEYFAGINSILMFQIPKNRLLMKTFISQNREGFNRLIETIDEFLKLELK